ncbi:Minf_1886 family protein [Cerasicoccus fimbriatus]|uniref:Minf_1886 family protein n=1 Tax=Cerasicoccus fimbriatus TaxID=3014554 RepID=UPI0022B2DAE6|nr:Minf_1886 family protein [Cerasicoccus sp. TK19100]
MPSKDFDEVVSLIRKEDSRFEAGAYHFVRLGLDHTIKSLKEEPERETRHVSGHELLSGIRDYALDQYGPLAYTLLSHWGVKRCEDFGDIVFNLVEWGVLGKTENDQPEDFAGGYDFREAFLQPFEPKSRRLNPPGNEASSKN